MTANGDEYQTLGLVRRYLSETGIDPELIFPIMRRMGELRDAWVRSERQDSKGGALKPTNQVHAMAFLAASSAVMHDRKKLGVREADAYVAKYAKIDKSTLTSFRKNVEAGNLAAYQVDTYEKFVKEIGAFTEEEFEPEIRRCALLCGDFLRNP
ncbi:hypothetical protein EOA27_14150 [Mesorhizobium sp. M2A.F.Ca.ET.037.01.1.1]|uniref:hypothetical protein n=1 Tax=unclassified Mesorhizobium TaxID=325217 RepID=UPI000FCCC7D8|nr:MULTISPECIES: hypothetical protein [unclassified Mesorhizobium]RUY10307.1 hypothetical protein EOA25_08965 [Mesorhizobium sp. M2A.F.Ca.ET.040.01.1.1]RUX17945.1 hypothetical protein EOA27_14150 [Mesorhizobium sp. M2A.F.Ca.ET.037.01.1.1]RWA93639.1 MAG: hypothetical protein EOQ31_00635 [Mesorhizobium sp.]TIV13240.1 MAG: hypothetical protein E5V95_34600 [Mesorhizobium sp.]TIV30458.1 MAG: hypothetical protein E5V99_17715 [Mesorhizobium sp.]